jgi:hypothetical protein
MTTTDKVLKWLDEVGKTSHWNSKGELAKALAKAAGITNYQAIGIIKLELETDGWAYDVDGFTYDEEI